MPKVSVLIAVYNAEQFVANTIKSILEQTYTDFEIIIINDASTDRTEEKVLSFADPRIRYYKNNANMGISATRNQLIALSEGEYLAIMDHDDISLPQRLEKQVTFLERHRDISVVGSWVQLFCSHQEKGLINKIKFFIRNLGWVWKQPQNPTIVDALHGCPVMHPASMIRKSDIMLYNLRYNEEYSPAEDYKLWTDMLMCGLRVANLQEVLFKYNLHGKNFSIQRKKQMRAADKKVKRDILNYLNIPSKFYPYIFVIMQKLRLNIFKKEHH